MINQRTQFYISLTLRQTYWKIFNTNEGCVLNDRKPHGSITKTNTNMVNLIKSLQPK